MVPPGPARRRWAPQDLLSQEGLSLGGLYRVVTVPGGPGVGPACARMCGRLPVSVGPLCMTLPTGSSFCAVVGAVQWGLRAPPFHSSRLYLPCPPPLEDTVHDIVPFPLF